MLSLAILSPFIGSIVIALIPRKISRAESAPKTLFIVALLFSILSLAATLLAVQGYDNNNPLYQLREIWFQDVVSGAVWSFALDGISLGLFVLTAVLFPLGIISSELSHAHQRAEGKEPERIKLFWISLLFLETTVLGVFAAENLIVYYVFWEVMLLPMVLLIGIWGGADRKPATIKFFLYTFAGSVFLLLGIVIAAFAGEFPITQLQIGGALEKNIRSLDPAMQKAIFWAFIISFLIKIPAFPVHTWLPHAHTQAPTVGSIILAGVLLKMGTYSLYRFSLSLFPDLSMQYQDLFLAVGVIGILYGAWLAWAQTDIKRLVAYSSVSHMGYILIGAFSGTDAGLNGGYMQMINHGLSTGLLFLLVGMIYDRTHTRELKDYGGLAQLSPAFAILFMIATLSSVGLPGTNGFVGEFLILLGTFTVSKFWGILAISGVIFGAVYMLHAYKEVFFGEVSDKLKEVSNRVSLKLNKAEILVAMPFVIFIFWLGVKPELVLDSGKASIQLMQADLAEAKERVTSNRIDIKVSNTEVGK